MSLPKKSLIFESLNVTKHRIDEDIQNSLFPDTIPNTSSIHAEYWIYSDLFNLFGPAYFPTHPSMSAHTWERIQMPSTPIKRGTPQLVRPTLEFHDNHVKVITHAYTLFPYTMYKNAKDLCLSRYACWCMTRNIPQITFAHTYFMAPTIEKNMTFNRMRDIAYQFARIPLRQEYTKYEKCIGGILNKYNGHFSLFHHNMTRAFFYGYSADDLKHIHRISPKSNDPLANYVGSASLHAMTCAMRNAIDRFNETGARNVNVLDEYLYNELIAQRTQMIKRTDLRPEQDIFQTPISSVSRDLATTEREFIKKYANEKLR